MTGGKESDVHFCLGSGGQTVAGPNYMKRHKGNQKKKRAEGENIV